MSVFVPNPQVDPQEVMIPFYTGRGDRLFVHAGVGSDDNSGKNANAPMATILAAVAKCVASRGDEIVALPGHAETINAALLCNLSSAGVTVAGLGSGSSRPTLTFSTSTLATLTISAANVTVKNLLLLNNVDSQAIMVDVNAADFTIEDCEFREGSAKQPLVFVDINGGQANAADRCKIRRCTITAVAAGVCDAGIEIGAVEDGVEITDCVIQGDFDDAGIHSASVLTNAVIKGNVISNLQTGDHAIELSAAATGFALDNRLYGDTLGTILDPGSLKCLGNMEADAIDQAGIPSPATSAGALPANSIGAATFAAGAIDATAIAAAAIDAATFAAGAIDAAAVATNAVDADALAADAVAKIGANTGPGTYFWVTKTLTSSAVVQAGVDITGVSSGGALAIEDIIVKTNGTGLATGTNFAISSDNANGLANIFVETVANLGASKTMDLTGASVTKIRTVLETGKKLIAKSTVADCTGAGTIDVYIKLQRLAAGATIAAA